MPRSTTTCATLYCDFFGVIEERRKKSTCRKNSPAATIPVTNKNDALCNCIACGVENEKEHASLMSWIRQHVDIQYRWGLMSRTQSNKLNYQTPCMSRNKSNVSNHHFVNCKHAMKKTTITNECRHENYKHGEDRVQPNFNMAQSAHELN